MKLIIAIISNDDSYDVLSELTKAGFDATKLSTTGGFLSAGNVTLLIGVEDSRVDYTVEHYQQNIEDDDFENFCYNIVVDTFNEDSSQFLI